MIDLYPVFKRLVDTYLSTSDYVNYYELQNEIVGRVEGTINSYTAVNKQIEVIVLDPIAYAVICIYLMNEHPTLYKNIVIDNYKFDGNIPGIYKLLIDDTLPSLTVKVFTDIASYFAA